MSYYEMLGLDREPFSNSPDPDFFHSSPRHAECLRRLEIAVRLKRGLCVVMGEVGTGKTTVCRRLIRTLGYDPAVSVHLLLDPSFEDPRDFLAAVAVSFGIAVDGEDSAARIREAIQDFLLSQTGRDGKTVVLCVDEGQKITASCLEILRELLNFETNTHKLLQIVVFAQNEFAGILRSRKNLADRVNTRIQLKPLSFSETRRLIRTRLRLAAGDFWKDRDPNVFSRAALYAIHRACGGYPRRIMRLCHATLLETVGREKTRAGLGEVLAARRAGGVLGMSWKSLAAAAIPVAAVMVMLAGPGRERATQLLDIGLFRVGEAVSRATSSLPEMPDVQSVRRLIASLTELSGPDEIVPAAVPAETASGDAGAPLASVMPEVAPQAVQEEPAAPGHVVQAASESAAQAAAPVSEPAPAQPAVSPEPQPLSVPQALAAAESSLPAAPRTPDVTDTAHGALPAGFDPKAQHVIPDTLPTVAITPRAAAAGGVELALEDAEVIEMPATTGTVPAAAAPAAPVAPPALQPATASVAAKSGQLLIQDVVRTAPRQDSGQQVQHVVGDMSRPAAPPLILGEVVVRQGWSLSKAAARLYGNGGKRIMSALAEANPDIADLDMVRPGRRVIFPARRTEPLPQGAKVILLGRQPDLSTAFESLARIRENMPQAVLYAYYSTEKGLVFDLVLDHYHTDQFLAEKAVAALPGNLPTRARIVEYAGEGFVAYSSLEPAPSPGLQTGVRTVAQNGTAAP